MSADCLFCRIRDGEIRATKVYEDEGVLAFDDINPQAPSHLLIIPAEHVATANDLLPEHDAVVGRLIRVAAGLAAERGHAESGYRLVMNCQQDAGQTVFHIHLHLLAGRSLSWPPG